MMNYIGIWKNEKTTELLRISRKSNENESEFYLIAWGSIEGDFEDEQEVLISITDENTSYFSSIQGSYIIHNLNEKSILLNKVKFIKHISSNFLLNYGGMKILSSLITILLFLSNCSTGQNKIENDKSNSPKFVCSKEYVKVTKDTYNYYLQKLVNSGLIDQQTENLNGIVHEQLSNDNIICFFSIGDYGEEENIIIEVLPDRLTNKLFNILISELKKKENELDGANYMFRVGGVDSGYYGGVYSYKSIESLMIINDPITIRYSLVYLIDILDQTYSVTINTHNVDNDINKALISINGTKGAKVDNLGSIIFRDGKIIRKSSIVNPCIDYMKKENTNELINIEDYCSCFAEKLAENFNSTDLSFLDKTNNQASEFYSLAIEFFNLPNVKSIAVDCITDNLTDSKENLSISSEEQKRAFVEVFKNAIKSQNGYEEFEKLVHIDAFCECVVVNVLEHFSYKEIMIDPAFGENPEFVKIKEHCMQINQKNIY